jgi:hypothetical protein
MDNNLVNEVKKEILSALQECEESGMYPTICKLKRDKNGLAKLNQMVINHIVNNDMGIEQAIAHIESSWEI